MIAVSRVRKLLIGGLVLAVGIGFAWPFRKTGSSIMPTDAHDARLSTVFDSPATAPLVKQGSAQRHTMAKMASTGDSLSTPPPPREASFDLANHPALAKPSSSQLSGSVTPTDLLGMERLDVVKRQRPTSRPAYATAKERGKAERRQEILHVVRNTDTLEKLAKRYLGDSGRALEIFDLNRDQLSNPHLLPIGAKLRIPKAPDRELD